MKKLSTIASALVALATFSGLGIAHQKKQLKVPMPIRNLTILAAILMCMFALSGRAEAATARCLGNIQDLSGNVIVDLGTLATYKALFPERGKFQKDCNEAAVDAASSWLKNQGQMCHAFLAANGGTLRIHYKLGSRKWISTDHVTEARSYNYPKSCFGPTGSVFPSYYIMTLIYTPPGCTPSTAPTGYKCGSGSFVSYGNKSSTGSTVSIEKSVGGGTSLTATLNGALSIKGNYFETSASGSSITISKEAKHEVTWPKPGPVGPDGINHDYDQFLILLNPAVAISGWHNPVTAQNHAQWSLGTRNGEPMRIQRVQVSYLRCALAGIGPRPGNSGNGGGPSIYDPTGSCTANPFLRMQGRDDASAANGWLPGLTYDDYKQILAQDLFWNASPTNRILIPKSRFVQQTTNFTYDQAGGSQGASCIEQNHSISNSEMGTNTFSTQTQYQASMSVSTGFPIVKALLDLKLENSFTWTNKTSNSLTKADTQTASATVGCTSIDWRGPNFVTAYYDTLYGTFLFALDDGTGRAGILQGAITDMRGRAVPHEPLKLVVGKNTYQTFSRNNGSFQFLLPIGQATAGASSGTLFVGSTGAISKRVSVGPRATATVAIPTTTPPEQSEICVMRFEDKNGNGEPDKGESALPGGAFQIQDTSRNIVATIKTGDSQQSCGAVPAPGTYRVTEQSVPSGWTSTTASPQSVTVSPGQKVNLSFGNKKKEEGKCDLAIKQSISPNPLVNGEPATTTIMVTNEGNAPCQGVTTMTDAALNWLTVSSVAQGGSLWNCSVTPPNPGATITCRWDASVQAVPPGSLPTITITGNVTAKPGSSVTNCATLKSPVEDSTNNTACATVPVKTATPPVDSCVLDSGMTAASNTFARRVTLAQTFTPTLSGSLTKITHGLQSISGVTNYDLLVTTTSGGLPSWTGGTYDAPNVLFKATGLTVFSNSGVVNGVVTIPSGQEPFLTPGTQYAFILIPGSPATGNMAWRGNSGAGSYPNGSAYELNGTTWSVPATGPKDHGFKLDGLCP